MHLYFNIQFHGDVTLDSLRATKRKQVEERKIIPRKKDKWMDRMVRNPVSSGKSLTRDEELPENMNQVINFMHRLHQQLIFNACAHHLWTSELFIYILN